MSNFEEYKVNGTNELAPDMFELTVDPKPGSPASTPVTTILLINGATTETNRKGIELGYGATVYLKSTDFARAREYIDVNDIVNYLSDDVSGVGARHRALIQNFNFPMSE